MSHFRQDFIRFDIEQEVLYFDEFKTKAGRLSLTSPYLSASFARLNIVANHNAVHLKKFRSPCACRRALGERLVVRQAHHERLSEQHCG